MSNITWERRHEAFKAVHDKIAEVLAKLDDTIDPQTVEIIASITLQVIQSDPTLLKATVTQAEKDRTITELPKKGTPTRINVTASGEIVAAPSANYHLELRSFVISVDADEIVRLRWGGATGAIICMLPTKGIIAMNLINIDEKGGGGASPDNLYLEKTGTGNCQGTVWTQTVAD